MMRIKIKSTSFRFFSLFISLLLLVNMFAISIVASEPRASYYLDSYNSYVYNAVLGKIRVYFDVTGVNYMDEIGTLNIKIYESTDKENWTRVDTLSHDDTPGMLGYDDVYHSGYVEYSGTVGRYYKAYVCIWAGKNGSGDTRYMWTNIKKATLLPG